MREDGKVTDSTPASVSPSPTPTGGEPTTATPAVVGDLTTAVRTALARCVREVEAHVAAAGWDGPIRLYALVDSARAIAQDPALAGVLPSSSEPHHLAAIEQEGLPEASSLGDLLAQLAWPQGVDGAAVVLERVVASAGAEDALTPEQAGDEEAAAAALRASGQAQDVRIAVGVLRSGESWCAVRARSHDHDEAVIGSPDTVPALVEALALTLQ